jgi:hypothetical protein
MLLPRTLAITLLIIASLTAGCSDPSQSKGTAPVIYKTAEDARAHIKATKITGPRFDLAVSNNLTFAGHPDPAGMGMALILDAILAQKYFPDGFDQLPDHRVYHYKPMK